MKKIYIIIPIIIVSLLILLYLVLINKSQNLYSGTAKILNNSTFQKAEVEIKDKNGKIIGNSYIYSNIFEIGSSFNIEYTKKLAKINITKLYFEPITIKEKKSIVSNINNDVTIKKYKESISGTVDIGNKEGSENQEMPLFNIYAIPERISGQYYVNIINPKDFFEIKKNNSDGIYSSIEKDLEVTINIPKDSNIKSLKNLQDSEIIVKVNYNNGQNSFKFNSLGSGIYIAQIEFKNGDIINYIFL